MKEKALTPKQISIVPCPTCGAYSNKPCELASGQRRTQAHRARQWAASDKRHSEEMEQATARILKKATNNPHRELTAAKRDWNPQHHPNNSTHAKHPASAIPVADQAVTPIRNSKSL